MNKVHYEGAIAELKQLLAQQLSVLSDEEIAVVVQTLRSQNDADEFNVGSDEPGFLEAFLTFSVLWGQAVKHALKEEALEIANRWQIFINPYSLPIQLPQNPAPPLPSDCGLERIGVSELWRVDILVLTRLFGWREIDSEQWSGPPVLNETSGLPLLMPLLIAPAHDAEYPAPGMPGFLIEWAALGQLINRMGELGWRHLSDCVPADSVEGRGRCMHAFTQSFFSEPIFHYKAFASGEFGADPSVCTCAALKAIGIDLYYIRE